MRAFLCMPMFSAYSLTTMTNVGTDIHAQPLCSPDCDNPRRLASITAKHKALQVPEHDVPSTGTSKCLLCTQVTAHRFPSGGKTCGACLSVVSSQDSGGLIQATPTQTCCALLLAGCDTIHGPHYKEHRIDMQQVGQKPFR